MAGAEKSASTLLLQEARAGSDEALGAVLDACGQRLLALIRLRLGDGLRREVESRDVLQTTFLKALEHLDQFQGSGSRSLMAWLAAIANNEIRARAEYQQRQRRDARARVSWESDLPVAASVTSAVSKIQQKERSRALEAALLELTDDHREAILLRQFEELTFAEVGARMGRSEDAARMLYARALAALTMKMSVPPTAARK